ncbi:MAG: heme-binding protein [Gammaproteobacteria bacterium]|nr:heme-binding protein [Gammaproteobacteria bacterium]MDH3466897.1 heme-binding protein [Gammaproteobacteria bacterium]
MIKTLMSIAVLLVLCNQPAVAAEGEGGLVTFRAMTTELALQAAQAALASCRKSGYQIAVAIVDRGGNVQVVLRDRFAGPHTPNTAISKAWTAVSFRTDTTELADLSQAGQPQSGVRNVPGALMIGGGKTIESAGSIVGGIGISGAPGGDADDVCAVAGIEAISDTLNF